MQTPWRKLYILSFAGALSWLGSALTTFAVILRDKDHIGAGGVSLYLVAFGLPSIFMAPVSGWVADRFSSRQVILPALAVMGLSSFSLSQGLPIWWTPFALLITACAGTLVGPAMQAAEVTITNPDDLPRVTGLMQSMASAGTLFAPALGGILVSTTGYFWPFVIDAISFWLLAVVFFAINVNRHSVQHQAGQKVKAMDGLKIVFAEPLIRALVILVGVLIIALGSFNGQGRTARQHLHLWNCRCLIRGWQHFGRIAHRCNKVAY
jgi:MFS transporter, DHA3 family, macrolide efflux protein